MVFILTLTNLSAIFSQTSEYSGKSYLNVGVKIAYQFGKGGGMVYGLEVSKSDFIGEIDAYVFDLDYFYNSKNIAMHLGYEVWNMYGMDLGPTVLFQKNKIYFGGTVNAYIGKGAYGFVGLNYFPRLGNFYTQVGTYLKYPILLDENK